MDELGRIAVLLSLIVVVLIAILRIFGKLILASIVGMSYLGENRKASKELASVEGKINQGDVELAATELKAILEEHSTLLGKKNRQLAISMIYRIIGDQETLNLIDMNNIELLIICVLSNDQKLVKQCIKSGVDINQKNRFGETPLKLAAENGLYVMVRLLIEAGANLNEKNDNDGTTPLGAAASRFEWGIARLLIDNGADVNTCLPSGELVLHSAIQAGEKEVVDSLVENGADANEKVKIINENLHEEFVALSEWAERSGNKEIAIVLRNAIAKAKKGKHVGPRD